MPGAAMKARLAAIVASQEGVTEPPEGFFRLITPDVQDRPLPDLATLEDWSLRLLDARTLEEVLQST